MKNNFCDVCLNPITNPVCGQCYSKQINYWLKDRGMDGRVRQIILKKIMKNIKEESTGTANCIACNKGNLGLCSYCFFLKSSRSLLELNLPETFIEDFLAVFSYTREHGVEEPTYLLEDLDENKNQGF